MIKTFMLLALLGLPYGLLAQNQATPKDVIIQFFEAFHKQDTTAMRLLVNDSIRMESISSDEEQEIVITQTSFSHFLKSIASIPKTTEFREELLEYTVKEDALMANVWTPYTFFINGKPSHCGTNNFQLVLENKVWKIIYIVDTRIKTDCI